MSIRALVVDDDAAIRFTLRQFLEELDVEVQEAESAEQGLERHRARPADVLVVDLRMPGMGGMALLRKLGSDASRVIILTAHGSEREAVEAMKLGAADYLTKPFEPDTLTRVLQRVLEPLRLGVRAEQLEGELHLARSMVFASAPMRGLALKIQRVGPKDVTVLIRGESGTGKERVAEAIVHASERRDGPYVRFNCAALSPELAEAELFGHEAGAFTGALRARVGLFREADGGTLLLDEVGELDERAQAKLLRVLQERKIRPVGADAELSVDVRVLASTHRDLEERVSQGQFREDLLYRLRVVTLWVPPLRERPDDIRPLVRHFLSTFGRRFGVRAVPSEGLYRRLEGLPWRGNVRELENTLESLVALSDGSGLDLNALPSDLHPAPARRAGLKERMDAFERGVLLTALDEAAGNRTEAARQLKISRATLHDKLRRHRIGGAAPGSADTP